MALSANAILKFEVPSRDNTVPVLASSTVYKGSAVGISSGYGRALVAGDPFVGFALEKVDNASGSSGDLNVTVQTEGKIVATITSVAVTDVGKPVYLSADDTFTLTQGSNSRCGVVHRYDSANTAVVAFQAQTLVSAGVTALTDSTGVTPNTTIVNITPANTITDSSGGTDPGDDTIAAVTNTTALTDNNAGTADDTVEDVADIALSTTDTYTDAAVNNAVNTAIASISNNFEEITTQLAIQRTANTAILAAIAQLAAKVNTTSTAITALETNDSDLATKINELIQTLG